MPEHCVKICLKLSSGFGSEHERETINDWSDKLEEAIEEVGAGEFDGDEFGHGECTLYMYGPDADRLFEAIQQALADFPLAKGGYVSKRYGPPVDGVREVRMNL